MSREQLRRRFCGLTCPNPEDHGQKPWMCETVTDEIERLLADERADVLHEVLAFNTQLGCTPQEGYKDLTDALRDTKHLVADAQQAEREEGRSEALEATQRTIAASGLDDEGVNHILSRIRSLRAEKARAGEGKG